MDGDVHSEGRVDEAEAAALLLGASVIAAVVDAVGGSRGEGRVLEDGAAMLVIGAAAADGAPLGEGRATLLRGCRRVDAGGSMAGGTAGGAIDAVMANTASATLVATLATSSPTLAAAAALAATVNAAAAAAAPTAFVVEAAGGVLRRGWRVDEDEVGGVDVAEGAAVAGVAAGASRCS